MNELCTSDNREKPMDKKTWLQQFNELEDILNTGSPILLDWPRCKGAWICGTVCTVCTECGWPNN